VLPVKITRKALLPALAALVGLLVLGCPRHETEKEKIARMKTFAQEVCRVWLEDRLKAPSTVKYVAEDTMYLGNDTYRTDGKVDAQNSFGAMIRTGYRCVAVRDESAALSWRLQELAFDSGG